MPRRTPPTVVLLAAPETLTGVDRPLRRAGVRVIRMSSVQLQPVAPDRWLPRVTRASGPDTVVVTSRAAVGAGVLPWLQESNVNAATVEFWAVGPATARALREAGLQRVHRPPAIGALAVAQALDPTVSRAIVYFRSDVAGPRLARALRARRYRVLDVVVYRLRPAPRLNAPARRTVLSADLVLVSSPSGLADLRRRLGRPAFSQLAKRGHLVVLGNRSLRAARHHGFQNVSVVAPGTAQRFTRDLFRELENARP